MATMKSIAEMDMESKATKIDIGISITNREASMAKEKAPFGVILRWENSIASPNCFSAPFHGLNGNIFSEWLHTDS